MRASHLIGLLILDLVGFAPGAFVASVVAATALLAIDARGLVTLSGLIRWGRLNFRLKVLVALLEIVLFQFLVLAYLSQRLYRMASRTPASRPAESSPEKDFDEVMSATPQDADAIQRALNALLLEVRYRLPQDLLEKVYVVASAIGEILPAYRGSNLSPEDRFVVERTATDYLPGAVQGYLKLSAAYRSIPLPEADGKTASEVLLEQLDLLIQRMRQVTDAAYRKDLEALLVHGRFLHSKFGPSTLRINNS